MSTMLRVSTPFAVRCEKAIVGKARQITKKCVNDFWEQDGVDIYAEKQGCYIFAMKSSHGYLPWYVGKATKCFKQECFHHHKLLKFNEVLFKGKSGTPVLFFVAPGGNKKKVRWETIEQMETFLIQSAYSRNPGLKNDTKKKGPEWGIKGVVRSGQGQPETTAKAFTKMMGL